MAKPRTPEEDRIYQADRRAKLRAAREALVSAEKASGVEPTSTDEIAGGLDLEDRSRRQQAPRRGWHNPFTDGMPDTPELIARMSQKQRDAILARIPSTPRRG